MASYLLVAILVVAPSLWLLRQSLDRSLEKGEQAELKAHVEAVRDRIAAAAPGERDAAVRDMARLLGLRVTLIGADGVVLSDSALPGSRISSLDNHALRPEVAAALRGELGVARRVSVTVGSELIYAALPLPASAGQPRQVVRLASPASAVREAVSNTLRAMKFSAGLGVTAAIGFSFIAALSVSWPLRRMRDAAMAFAHGDWVRVMRVRTGDELEDLSLVLDELGQKLSEKLIEVGAQEALVTQAVESFPLPAMLLDPELRLIAHNGAFRRYAGLDAANEVVRLGKLLASSRLEAARAEAERTGLPVELALEPLDAGEEVEAGGTLVPLSRPNAPPLWLLLISGESVEEQGQAEALRNLTAADATIDRVWDQHLEMRPTLAELRQRLDEAVHALGRPEPVGVAPADVSALVERVANEVRVLYPARASLLIVETPAAACLVAESAGLAARALRMMLAGAMRALPPGRSLEVTAEVEQARVKILVEGAAPVDLRPVVAMARALGGDASRVKHREREAAWLALPRA